MSDQRSDFEANTRAAVSVRWREASYVEVSAFRDEARRERAEIDDLPSIRWFVLEHAGGIVGLVGLMRLSSFKARMRARYVLPEYRGLGYGRLLAEAWEAECEGMGITTLETHTKPWLADDHKSRGWVVVRSYETVPEVVMEKRIGP